MKHTAKQFLQQIMGNHFQGLFALGGFLLGLLFVPLASLNPSQVQEVLVGLLPEAVGICVTVLVIDRMYRWRESQQLKKQLIEQLGSRVNSIAINAAEGLWANKWWADGSLKTAQLERADLSGVDFGKANLTGVCFYTERYGGTTFSEETILPDETRWHNKVDMGIFTDPNHKNYWKGYGLRGARRVGADFQNANLQGADLRGCDLRRANMRGANLRGVRMEGAKLENADLTSAFFDERTILPDGSLYVEGYDLRKFGVVIDKEATNETK